MTTKRGDFSKKSTTYKFYKKGYSSVKPKYIAAGQDLLIETDIVGSLIGNAFAEASYNNASSTITIFGSGDSNFGLSADVTVLTDKARLMDLNGIIAKFNHSYSVSNMGGVSSYSIYLFDYNITRNITANTLSLFYKGNLVSAVAMSTNYDWLRIREQSGTVYIERSPDGTTWSSWASRTVSLSDVSVSIMKITADIGAGGLGDAIVNVSSIDISDAANNLLMVESKKVLSDLQFVKNINTPAAATTLEMDYSPKQLPDSALATTRLINHSTNPSFETGSGTVEVRRNHVTNPRMSGSGTTATSWSNYSSGTVTGTRSVSGNIQTITQSTGTGRIGVAHSLDSLLPSLNAGRAITLSIDVKSLSLGTGTAVIRAEAGGAPFPGSTKIITSTGRQYLKFQTTETGRSSFTLYVWVQGGTGTISFTDVMAEDIDAELPYFDGSTNNGFDTASLTPAWTGTANASASVLNGVTVTGVAAYNLVVWRSLDSPNNGNSFVRALFRNGGGGSVRATDSVGVTTGLVTVISNVRVNRDIALRPSAWKYNGVNDTLFDYEPFTKDQWTEVRKTYIATGVPEFGFFSNLFKAGDIIDIDNHMVVKGNYTGEYFDGSSAAVTGWNKDETSYKDLYPNKYNLHNAHLLFGNTVEAIVGHKRNGTLTPENVSVLKFSGYIDTIDRDYNTDTISVVCISHGEILSNIIVGYADSIVTSEVLTQKTQNASESTADRRQTFKPRNYTKLNGVRVRLGYTGGGNATVVIGIGSTTLATSYTMSWSGSLSAGVYSFDLLSPAYLTAGLTYWIRVDGLVNWYYQNSDVYADGKRQTLSGGVWSDTAADAYFELYTTNPSVKFQYSGTVEGLVDRVFAEVDKNYGLISKAAVINPAYNVIVDASVDTGRSLLETAIKMSPSGYWSNMNLGTGGYELKPYPTTASHTFIFGRDFIDFTLSESIANTITDLVFIGGDIDDVQTKLAIRTTDRGSIGAYKLGLGVESNGKVTRYDSAQILSDYEIASNNKPRLTTSLVIPASEYDIETLDTGQLVKILNADSELLVDGLLIASIDYSPTRAVISLDNAPQTINTTVDKIKRDLNNSETSGVASVI